MCRESIVYLRSEEVISLINETDLIPKGPIGGKRKRTDSETARDQLISTMTKTFEEANRSEEDVEDDISVYVNNMGRKLRKISDERTLVLVQNEMDQVIFRGNV